MTAALIDFPYSACGSSAEMPDVRFWHLADILSAPAQRPLLGLKLTSANLAGMIRIATIGDLIQNGFGLNAHCEACNRYVPVNLLTLARQYGREVTFLKPASPIRLRCSRCGSSPCDYHLAPPVPGG